MACSLTAILRPFSVGSSADTQRQNELTGRGRQVMALTAFVYRKGPWAMRKHLTPRPFVCPDQPGAGCNDRKPSQAQGRAKNQADHSGSQFSVLSPKEHSLDYPGSRRLVD